MQAIPNPVQAYLRNCTRVQENEDKLVIWFNQQWKNHVKNLRQEENREKLVEAVREKTGEDKQIEIKIESGENKQESKNVDKSKTKPQPEKGSSNQGLLKETMEIFDVEEVNTVEKEQP